MSQVHFWDHIVVIFRKRKKSSVTAYHYGCWPDKLMLCPYGHVYEGSKHI